MDKKDIYCITNNINGMQYVGQSKDAHKRFKAHALAKDKKYFHSEIRKYELIILIWRYWNIKHLIIIFLSNTGLKH